MLLNIVMMAYAVVVTFVLATAERNQREMRPHGAAVTIAGQVAFMASCTAALLLSGWALLYASGRVSVLPPL